MARLDEQACQIRYREMNDDGKAHSTGVEAVFFRDVKAAKRDTRRVPGWISVSCPLQCRLVGSAALLLLFIGIHNAWDTVTWHVFVQRNAQRGRDEASQ